MLLYKYSFLFLIFLLLGGEIPALFLVFSKTFLYILTDSRYN